MTNAIARQVLVNGSKKYIVKYTIVGDGSGEETASLVNAVSGDMGVNNKITEVHANLTGFSGQLMFDATTDVYACQIAADADVHLDFTKVGGLINNAGTGKTGDILLKTIGLGSGDAGTIVLCVTKKP